MENLLNHPESMKTIQLHMEIIQKLWYCMILDELGWYSKNGKRKSEKMQITEMKFEGVSKCCRLQDWAPAND